MLETLATYALGVGFPLMGGLCCYAGARLVREARRALKWPRVAGRIIESRLALDETHHVGELRADAYYGAVIRYEYTVKGRTFTGDTVSVGRARTNVRAFAAGDVARYPVGREVTVYVHPRNPAESLLEPGGSSGGTVFLLIGGAFIVIGPVFIWLMTR